MYAIRLSIFCTVLSVLCVTQAFSFEQMSSSEDLIVIDVTDSKILEQMHEGIVEKAKHPIVCELLKYHVRAKRMMVGNITSNKESDWCLKKFGNRGTEFYWDVIDGRERAGGGGFFSSARNQVKFVYLVLGTGNSLPAKSWTTHDKRTYLFLDSHTDYDDLLRSLIHEYAISQDVKYDATLWEMLGVNDEVLLGQWGRVFYKGWYSFSLVRIGLSTIRSENAEQMILEDGHPPFLDRNCYEHIQTRLVDLIQQQRAYVKTEDYEIGSSFYSNVAYVVERRWGYIKGNNLIESNDLVTWINELKKNDPQEKLCQYAVSPLFGSQPNYISAGPRPRIGTGVSSIQTPIVRYDFQKEKLKLTPEVIQEMKIKTDSLEFKKNLQDIRVIQNEAK